MRHLASPRFWALYHALPADVRDLADKNYADGIAEILNVQPKGRNAKPYQVKQVRTVIVKYRLSGGIDGQ